MYFPQRRPRILPPLSTCTAVLHVLMYFSQAQKLVSEVYGPQYPGLEAGWALLAQSDLESEDEEEFDLAQVRVCVAGGGGREVRGR